MTVTLVDPDTGAVITARNVRDVRHFQHAYTLRTDYANAVKAKREHLANMLMARYRRFTAQIGYDPLKGL